MSKSFFILVFYLLTGTVYAQKLEHGLVVNPNYITRSGLSHGADFRLGYVFRKPINNKHTIGGKIMLSSSVLFVKQRIQFIDESGNPIGSTRKLDFDDALSLGFLYQLKTEKQFLLSFGINIEIMIFTRTHLRDVNLIQVNSTGTRKKFFIDNNYYRRLGGFWEFTFGKRIGNRFEPKLFISNDFIPKVKDSNQIELNTRVGVEFSFILSNPKNSASTATSNNDH